jgi:hypothetical protein
MDKIINKIKNGKVLTISCSSYEELFYFRNGKFMSTFDNGLICEARERSESTVRSAISRAQHDPDGYDMFFEEGDAEMVG